MRHAILLGGGGMDDDWSPNWRRSSGGVPWLPQFQKANGRVQECRTVREALLPARKD